MPLYTPTASSSTPADDSVTSAKILDGAIVNADISATAAIAESKLSLASDAAAGTASRRTLGTAATAAAAGNDARLSDTRTPSAASVTDAMIATTLSPSKITGTAVVDADARLTDTRTPTDNSVTSAKIVDGAIVNADVNASAAIAYSKLALAGSVVAADVTAGTLTQKQHAQLARPMGAWLPTNAIAQTVSRSSAANNPAQTSGTLYLHGGIVVPGGQAVSSITFVSEVGASGPTSQWFAIYDKNRGILATTVDDGSTAWGTNAAKTLLIATALRGATPGGTWTPTVDTEIYVAICQNAGTAAVIRGTTGNSIITGIAPILAGSSNTGLAAGVASAPATATALTAVSYHSYAYVS